MIMSLIPTPARRFFVHVLVLLVTGCSATPMTWQGSASADATKDEADCRAKARQEAARRLPYGDGPPLYGFYSNWSMLSWKQEIDNARYYLERDLTHACMRSKGY
jgi:hypothetical protein